MSESAEAWNSVCSQTVLFLLNTTPSIPSSQAKKLCLQ